MYHPGLYGPRLLQSAAVCALIGIILTRNELWHRPGRLIYVAALAAVFAIPFTVIMRTFGGFDVLALVFHAQFGVEGTTFAGFGSEIAEGVGAVLAVLFAGYALARLLGRPAVVHLLTALALILLNPVVRYGHEYATAEIVESDLHTSLRDVDTFSEPNVLPDIIVVYLEGIERAYSDRARYGDVFAPLETYEAQGVSLRQVRQVRGTGWSLAGLVATQCGLPLLPNGLRNHYGFSVQVDFLGSHTCLGDITHDLGYQNSFVFGGIVAFGGMDHFFRSHKISNIVDYEVMKGLFPPAVFEDARSGPILDDEAVFVAAKDVYNQMRAQQDPILLMVETYGPHGTTSLLSGNCTESGRAEVSPDVTRAIDCTLKNMVPFLDHIEQNRGDRPTVVVLTSDHINHDIEIRKRLRVPERSNTVIMYGLGFEQPFAPSGTVIDRPSTMMDVFPTILAYSGLAAKDVKAGMGRSLFGEATTLIEDKGYFGMHQELFPNPLLNARIWQTHSGGS